MIGNKSYLSNKTTFSFDESNSLSFKTNRNLDKDISEYYTLIYEYKNDCLTAAIEYDKQYYTDSDLKPEKNIFFSIKIIPFGKINTPSIN
jgi:LPS-assembly protein